VCVRVCACVCVLRMGRGGERQMRQMRGATASCVRSQLRGSWRVAWPTANCQLRGRNCCATAAPLMHGCATEVPLIGLLGRASRQPLDVALMEPQWSLNTALVQPYTALIGLGRALIEPQGALIEP
jgi:hypothetical protein